MCVCARTRGGGALGLQKASGCWLLRKGHSTYEVVLDMKHMTLTTLQMYIKSSHHPNPLKLWSELDNYIFIFLYS